MMTFRNAIRQGFRVTNKNWQLVVIKIAFLFLTLIGLVLAIILPAGAVLIMLGYDVSDLIKGFDFFDFPSQILSKYLPIGIALIGIILFYILLVLTGGLFLFGASCGMLARGIKVSNYKFSLGDFFVEGKRLFFPFLRFLYMVSFIIIIEVFFLLFYFFCTSIMIDAAQDLNATLGIFIKILVRLVTFVFMFFLIFGTLSIIYYALGILFLKGGRIFDSFKEAFTFVTEKPSAFWFYCLMITGYFLIYIFIVITGSSFTQISDQGFLLLFPYFTVIYAIKRYSVLLVLSSLFSYYGGSVGLIAEMSSLQIDISSQASQPSFSQGQTDTHE